MLAESCFFLSASIFILSSHRKIDSLSEYSASETESHLRPELDLAHHVAHAIDAIG